MARYHYILCQTGPISIGPYLWNDLTLNIRLLPSLASFKYHLKHYLLRNINPCHAPYTMHNKPCALHLAIGSQGHNLKAKASTLKAKAKTKAIKIWPRGPEDYVTG